MNYLSSEERKQDISLKLNVPNLNLTLTIIQGDKVHLFLDRDTLF